MTLTTLVDLSITGEQIMRDFYLGLVDKFSNHPEVSDFWKNMAEDEIHHIQDLEDIRASRTSKQLQETINPSFLHGLKDALNFNLKDKLESINNLDDANDVANYLETSEINKVFDLLITKKASSDDVHVFLKSTIEEHLKGPLECHEIFGNAESRQKIACKY